MKRIGSLLTAGALALSLVTLPAGAAEAAPALEETAQAAAQAALTAGGAQSIQYALWQDGEIILTGHAGNYSRTENRALTDDILYGVGSVSKTYTAAAVLKLVDEGKVELDAPVTAYLPDFTMADGRYTDITVRMLLNHSSGLPGSTIANGFLLNDPDTLAADTLLEELSSQTLKADPGAFSVYCNDGFTLAELVVEAVSGMDFDDYVRQAILEPAGLEDTWFPGEDFDQSLLAKTYYGADETRALPAETVGVHGTGGIYATASDLAAFGGAVFCEDGILSADAIAASMADEYARGIWPEDTEDVVSYGLGWDSVHWYPFAYSGIQAVTKGGDTILYHAGLVVIPEYDMAAAVLSSGGVSTYNEMAASQMLIAALAEQGVAVDQTPPHPSHRRAGGDARRADGLRRAVRRLHLGGYAHRDRRRRPLHRQRAPVLLQRRLLPGREPDGDAQIRGGGQRPNLPLAEGLFLHPRPGGAAQLVLHLHEAPRQPGVPGGSVRLGRPQRQALPGPEHEVQQHPVPLALPVAAVATDPANMPGYMVFDRIVDADCAEGVAQIPGLYGRDWQNITMTERNGVEYLSTCGGLYMDSAAAEPLFGGASSWSTIQADGYARWYQVVSAAGKTMTVQVPEHGGFAVYNAAGLPVAASWAWGDTSAVLPEGGWVVFSGTPGARFVLSLTADEEK